MISHGPSGPCGVTIAVAVNMRKKVISCSATDKLVYERQSAICKAFAHPSRIHLLDLLGNGERASSELQEELNISKANLSQHLTLLKSAGIIVTRRDGKQIFCSLAMPQVKHACGIIRDVLRAQIKASAKLV